MDETTRTEIQRVAARTLRDAGLTQPPLSVERLLEHVNLYRDYNQGARFLINQVRARVRWQDGR
ncbi:MAG: hypothetical protein HY701_01890 [Gemmatimonadetes bacterium]|nr:hypothetical protein [Gemmatimonadota bacterium]